MLFQWPNKTFYGSYVAASYGTDSNFDAPYDLRNNTNPVVNNTDGSIVGYKYFNFTKTNGRKGLQLVLGLVPEGIDGTITIMADRPWASQGGQVLGTIELKADMPRQATELSVAVPTLEAMTGKHALFLKFASDTKERSLCTLNEIFFK